MTYEYRCLNAATAGEFEDKLNLCGAEGFHIVQLIDVPRHFYLAVMERSTKAPTAGKETVNNG